MSNALALRKRDLPAYLLNLPGGEANNSTLFLVTSRRWAMSCCYHLDIMSEPGRARDSSSEGLLHPPPPLLMAPEVAITPRPRQSARRGGSHFCHNFSLPFRNVSL